MAILEMIHLTKFDVSIELTILLNY